MASFTDIIPQFNPYIQQLPVEAMVKVGMQKQSQYDEGVQKLQSYIDTVGGLEILRPQDKQYLQSKLNELSNNLRGVAAGDFSNFQLVNSVGGMIGQVGKDKVIQAAVESTSWDKQQRSLMQEDKKKGTLTPDNKYNYDKQLNNYLSEGMTDEQGEPIKFNGTYVPNFDVFKFAKETFDAVKPDGLSWDQVYETDANGNPKIDPVTKKPIYSPVMVRMEKEGIFPKKVKETLNQIFSDPRVNQQLRISGEYNYSNVDANGLKQMIQLQQEDVVSAYNNQIQELVAKKALSTSTEKDEIQQQIDALQSKLSETKSNYKDLEEASISNPDYIRGLLYKNDVKDRYTTMFGYTKQKSLTMDNPGWNANFKLMQEANEQDRWQKDFDVNEKWKTLEYEQRDRLAKKGKGPGDGTARPVQQGDQSSDLYETVHRLDADYSQASDQFNNGSNDFIWQMVFAPDNNNNKLLEDLVKKGNTREQAISILINNTAAAEKMTPEAYKATWGSWAEKQLNLKNPKDIPPELKDAHDIYKSTKKQFDDMSAIKSQVDETSKTLLGDVYEKISLSDIKPQKVKLYGKEYNLSKDDIFDLAVFLKGHQSSTGFLNDKSARDAAHAAEKRLMARGNEPLIEAYLRSNVASGGPVGVITMAERLFGSWNRISSNVTDVFKSDAPLDVDFSQVDKVYKIIDNEQWTEGIKKKAEVIKNIYGIRPNVKMTLLTGDTETDKSIVNDLRSFAGAYTDNQSQNLSRDFSSFSKSISGKLEDVSLSAQVILDANNNPQIEIVSYGEDGSRAGAMTIQPDEAAAFNIDINTLYEPKQVGILRNYLKVKNNKTSVGDPSVTSTYINGDAYFNKGDLKGMANSKYDVKANIKYANGKYYSYIYVFDGTKRNVFMSKGSENLTDVYQNLVQNVTPAWAEAILSTK
tara:strand:+ start:4976 stop:7732 length:2757 start_codon:yes stop_codon:yes gene_type:complete